MDVLSSNNIILLLQGNVGLIFTKGDLKEVSEEVGKYKVTISFNS
jgi:large subunit ribosomal protein LP0